MAIVRLIISLYTYVVLAAVILSWVPDLKKYPDSAVDRGGHRARLRPGAQSGAPDGWLGPCRRSSCSWHSGSCGTRFDSGGRRRRRQLPALRACFCMFAQSTASGTASIGPDAARTL